MVCAALTEHHEVPHSLAAKQQLLQVSPGKGIPESKLASSNMEWRVIRLCKSLFWSSSSFSAACEIST